MLYHCLLLSFLGPALAKIRLDRYATFYSSKFHLLSSIILADTLADDCDETLDLSVHSVGINMQRAECIRETGRQSFMPGKKDNKAGNFCFVWYEDGDGDCKRIGGSRLIHMIKEPASIQCENKDVAGHTSYHFEWARKNEESGEYVSHDQIAKVSC
jgi:hypothetical protein